MAKACFCGCGRPIGLSSRKLNRHGRLLTQQLMGIHAIALPKPGPDLSDDERQEVEQSRARTESFADEGTTFRSDLLQILHGEASIRGFDHPRMLAWIRAAGELNVQALGQ